jgi:hypothetical protein
VLFVFKYHGHTVIMKLRIPGAAAAFHTDLHSLSVTGPMNLERYIVENCEPRTVCSAFAALSGHTDRGLYSHYSMISNLRHQV